MELTNLTPALALQLGLLGSPSDPVGRFTMREGPSMRIVSEELGPLHVPVAALLDEGDRTQTDLLYVADPGAGLEVRPQAPGIRPLSGWIARLCRPCRNTLSGSHRMTWAFKNGVQAPFLRLT